MVLVLHLVLFSCNMPSLISLSLFNYLKISLAILFRLCCFCHDTDIFIVLLEFFTTTFLLNFLIPFYWLKLANWTFLFKYKRLLQHKFYPYFSIIPAQISPRRLFGDSIQSPQQIIRSRLYWPQYTAYTQKIMQANVIQLLWQCYSASKKLVWWFRSQRTLAWK